MELIGSSFWYDPLFGGRVVPGPQVHETRHVRRWQAARAGQTFVPSTRHKKSGDVRIFPILPSFVVHSHTAGALHLTTSTVCLSVSSLCPNTTCGRVAGGGVIHT